MKLTEEQRNASHCEDNLMLTACPGSGKTRVIISKLSRAVDEVRETPRSVACVTYTNTAVHEIEARLRHHIQPGDDAYYDICTIHSFCLNHIFRPFCHLIAGYKKGFKILTPDSADFEKIVTAVCAQFNRHNLTFQDFDEFTQLRLGVDGNPAGQVLQRGAITPQIASAYWKRMREAGYIDFANILYYSYRLLEKRPEILSYVSAKFAWILVDEFQDTTDIQVEILTLIANAGRTKFLLVGDPRQSIFGFAGARPDLADIFAERIKARTDLTLSGNFRCSTPIVKHAICFMRAHRQCRPWGRRATLRSHPCGRAAFGIQSDHRLFSAGARKLQYPDWRCGNPSTVLVFTVSVGTTFTRIWDLDRRAGRAAIQA
ncbi:MAG: ATP-dependent helicase [Alphaproteobacteria bacterium]